MPGSRWLPSTKELACCAGWQACAAPQQAHLRKRSRLAPQPAAQACCAGWQACAAPQQAHLRKRSRLAPQPTAQPAEDVIDLTGDDAPPAPALAPAPGPAATIPPQRLHTAGPSPEDVRLQALELEVHALRRELEVRAQGMVGRTSCS